MSKPNFVFILIDDMGWKDIACTGSEFYETPNIDRIAAEGMMFTNAYASCPVCSPTRASVLTGKYPARLGLTNFLVGRNSGILMCPPYIDHLPTEEYSLAKALKAGGYTTWHIGKWHLGKQPFYPAGHGFDVNVAGSDWGHPHKGYFSPWEIETLDDGPEGTFLTDRLSDEAVKLIESNDGTPFYLNMCYYAVHTPIQAKPEKIAKYQAKAKMMGLDEVDTFEFGEYFPFQQRKNPRRVKRRLVQSDPTYAALIESLDEGVGKLLDALERTGQADNTVVIFTSDNGGLATSEGSPTCNAPLAEGKGWMYEGGTREPLLVRWPGVTPAGSECDVPTTSTDFYPTFLEIAGLDPIPAQHCDGVSLAPLLRQTGGIDREAIFWHYPHYANQGGTPGCSVRCGDYKLIEFFENGALELYDLVDDPGETTDLAGQLPKVTGKLATMLAEWRESVGAVIPEENPDWIPPEALPVG